MQAEGQSLPGSSISVERLNLFFLALQEGLFAWFLGCLSFFWGIQFVAGSRSSLSAQNYSQGREERALARKERDIFMLLLQLSLICMYIFCCTLCSVCSCTQKFISLTFYLYHLCSIYTKSHSHSLSNTIYLCFSVSCISLSQCGEGVNEQVKLLWVCEVSIFVLPHTEHWQYMAWTGRVWE